MKSLGKLVCDVRENHSAEDIGFALMNFDKITVDDVMEFLDIEEHTRQTPEVRTTVQKFMNMYLPTDRKSVV